MSINHTIGQNIRSHREKLGLKQLDIANSLQVSPQAVSKWENGFLQQITESILLYDGIPVKYLGDGLLAFFSGPDHQQRAIKSSIAAKNIVNEDLRIGLHTGRVFIGSLGFKEYASLDISGTAVNTTFRILSTKSKSGINASKLLVDEARFNDIKNTRTEKLKGIDDLLEICEIQTIKVN